MIQGDRQSPSRLVLVPPTAVNVTMHPFASYVLRSYYKETGWNEDNLYANLTRSSNGKQMLIHVCRTTLAR